MSVAIYDSDGKLLEEFPEALPDDTEQIISLVGAVMAREDPSGTKDFKVRGQDAQGRGYWMVIGSKDRG